MWREMMPKVNTDSADYKQGFLDGLDPDKIKNTIEYKVGFFDGMYKDKKNPFRKPIKIILYELGYKEGRYNSYNNGWKRM